MNEAEQLAQANEELHRKDRHIATLETALTTLGHSLRDNAIELRVGARNLQGLQHIAIRIAEHLDDYSVQIFTAVKPKEDCQCK